jgi:hypothetical protein
MRNSEVDEIESSGSVDSTRVDLLLTDRERGCFKRAGAMAPKVLRRSLG